MTLDTPNGPITKFLKKCPKNAGKMMGKLIFSLLWCLIQKLDHNSGLHAKNQREISKNEVRTPPPPFVWKCGHSPFIIPVSLQPLLFQTSRSFYPTEFSV